MRKMKDSGIEWIGMIPEGWEGRRLKSVATLSPPVEISHVAPDDEVSFLPMDCVKQGTYIPNAAPVARLNASYCLFSQGDIVMAKVTPCFENGNIARADGLIRGVGFGSSELFVLRRKEGMCRDFLFWMLQAEPFRSKAIESMSGAGGLKRVSVDAVKNYWFFCPELSEQQRIADYLDRKCAKIDDTIDKQRVVIEKLKAYKQSFITHAVTKGLNPNAPMKDSGIEWIGKIPEGWRISKMKRQAIFQTGTTPPTYEHSFFDGEFKWFTPADFNNGLVLTKASRCLSGRAVEESVVPIYPPQSILMVCIGATTGKIGFTDSICSSNQQITAIVPSGAMWNKYLAYFLFGNSTIIKDTAQFTTLPIVNNQALGIFMIPVPPAKEQREIADYLDKKCADIDTAIAKKEALIEKLAAFKKSLIYECVTGKREVV